VAERRQPGDVGRVDLVPVGGEVVEGGLGVDGLPQDDEQLGQLDPLVERPRSVKTR